MCTGMAYNFACVHASALSCRLLSLVDTCKKLMGETGQAKLLLPLLTSKKNAVRWMTRQVRNCSTY